MAVSIAVIVLMVILKRIRPLEKFAAIIVLVVATIIVNVFKIQTALVGSIATIPNGLPHFMLPNFSLMPQLALGSISVALVALAQGAGISTAVPNPDGSKASQSRDFLGEGLGNLAGSFFQSMGTGGSLSRTGISVGAGANSRWGGVFAGLWLGLIVLLFGSYAEKVPLAVIGGMLVVIGIELIMARVPSARLVIRTGAWGSIVAMALTFFSALFIPLQYTIFLGALLSLLLYVGASSRKFRLQQAVRLEDGGWEMQRRAERTDTRPGHGVRRAGAGLLCRSAGAGRSDAACAWRHRAPWSCSSCAICSTITSTAIKWLERYAQRPQGQRQRVDAGRCEPGGAGHVEEERRVGRHWRGECLPGDDAGAGG